MRALESLSDRLLRVFAPQATAEASCCPPHTYYEYCYCSGGFVYQKICLYDCCVNNCYSCYKTTITC